MQKTVMISQPMRGFSDDEIEYVRERAENKLIDMGYSVIETRFNASWPYQKDSPVVSVPIWFIGNSLVKMSFCHAVYFVKGWEKARGCRIEHAVAEEYGLELMYEEDISNETNE